MTLNVLDSKFKLLRRSRDDDDMRRQLAVVTHLGRLASRSVLVGLSRIRPAGRERLRPSLQ